MYGVDATIFILKKTPDSLGDSLGPTLTGGIAPKITCLPSVFERSSQRSLASGLGLVLQVYGMDPLAFITGRISPDCALLYL